MKGKIRKKLPLQQNQVYTNEAIAAFHIKDLKSLIPEYLYYALESVDFLRYTDKAVKGKTLNKEKLKKLVKFENISNIKFIIQAIENKQVK